ncbi:MAG: sulfotransferase [Phycisphaerales bacterium]|nr:sulfotransferase [Phycisphaerales bacterium]
MLPNFLVIGAQKSATSSVCDILSMHPQCFMTEPKEPYFFSHDEVYAKGWDWYLSLFAGASAPGKKAIGEGSTTYTQQWLYPRAVDRIREHVPGARLIYIAREPLSRIESHYLHLASKGGREMREFNDAVRNYPAYIDNSLYTKQIDLYRHAGWPDERILVLFFEDFKHDTGGQMQRVYRFLGVDESFTTPPGWKAQHVSAEGRTDSGALRPLRKVPGFGALRDGAPAPVKEALRRILKKPITGRPEWDGATRAWAVERLRDDSRAFLARYGKPADFWGI